jgi:cyclopropane fatty-acyl-phospholipid synthase-like methyltransferase
MTKENFENKYMDKSWKEETHQSYKTEKIDNSVIKFHNFLNQKNVHGRLLDVGCGNGKNAIYFQEKGFKTTAIDFSEAAINICKQKSKETGIYPNFQICNILEFKTELQFEVLIDCGCLHHIRRANWHKYKKSINNLLKVGGYFYIHGISGRDSNKKLSKHPKKRNWVINKKGHYTTFLTDKDIYKLLGKNYKIVKSYEFKSQKSPLTVAVFYVKKVK